MQMAMLPSATVAASTAAKETAMPTARLPSIAIALALALATGVERPAAAQEQPQERCYGVALAGEAEGVDDREVPGSGSVDYQGNAWVWVPQGTCLTTPLPPRPDGTPRRGALQPLERDPAEG
jgi:uncharacterized membrane protein